LDLRGPLRSRGELNTIASLCDPLFLNNHNPLEG
jgi:hypothetical protein